MRQASLLLRAGDGRMYRRALAAALPALYHHRRILEKGAGRLDFYSGSSLLPPPVLWRQQSGNRKG